MNDNVAYTRHTPSFPLTHPVSISLEAGQGPGKEAKYTPFNILWRSYSSLTDATAYSGARFGQGSSLIITLDEVSCTGEEASLFSCMHTSSHDCTHTEDAAVLCSTRELNFTLLVHNTSSPISSLVRTYLVFDVFPLQNPQQPVYLNSETTTSYHIITTWSAQAH